MTKTVQVHAGDTLAMIDARFVCAWHRAERHELTPDNAEMHVGFESRETMVRILSPKRFEVAAACAPASGQDYSRAGYVTRARLSPGA